MTVIIIAAALTGFPRADEEQPKTAPAAQVQADSVSAEPMPAQTEPAQPEPVSAQTEKPADTVKADSALARPEPSSPDTAQAGRPQDIALPDSIHAEKNEPAAESVKADSGSSESIALPESETPRESEELAESDESADFEKLAEAEAALKSTEETVADERPASPFHAIARFAKPGRLDGIAAIVGDEIILNSELEAYAYMRLAALDVDPDEIDATELLRECLNDLIDNKVLLVRAIEDSTIMVRNDEVESTLNNHINTILRQNGITIEQFDQLLRAQQGTTLSRFRTEARRAIREQLLKQKLQQSYYFATNINRRDVERFYEDYIDSLPVVGESFELLRISLRLVSSDSVRQAAYDKIHSLKRRLDAGESFEELAIAYSESPEGPSGGSLGYLTKGSTTEILFEEHAFSLPVGRISEPFETRLGYHILLVEEKRDRRVKLRQILVRHMPTERQREATLATLDSLRQTITARAEFEAAARAMSADPVTRTRGGDLGWITMFEMTPILRGAVQELDEGQISEPVAEDNMLSIYMVNSRVDNRRLTLENDYPLIAEKAREIAAQKQLLESVRRWRERVFIDVRI